MLSKTRYGYRWRITALLFFATTVNYLDRSVLSILAPGLQQRYGITEIDYSRMVTAFQVAYGIGVLISGRLLDRYGSRIVFALAIALWSLAAMSHALAAGAAGFILARFVLGLGESANFPAAIKTVTEWFPRKERALATGIFNAGSNVGAIAAPILVPWLALRYGWQWAFLVTGVLGVALLLAWWRTYTRPEHNSRLTPQELAHIREDGSPQPSPISWAALLTKKETWVIAAARFLTDPVWWFLLYWLPKFLDKRYHVSLGSIGLPLVIVYLAADGGSIAGGWLSSYLIRRGWPAIRSRRTTMLLCAICALPLVAIGSQQNLWTSVFLVSLAAAAHQGWAANIFTLISDCFPANAVGSVVGLSTTAATLGSMLAATAIGWALQKTGSSYSPIFAIAGVLYLAAWLLIRTLIPNRAKLQL